MLSSRLEQAAGPAVALNDRQRALSESIRHRLANAQFTLRTSPCICGVQSNDVLVGNVDRYGLPMRSVVCLECGTVRADPYLDEAGLQTFYRDYYQDLYDRAPDPAAYFESQKVYGRRVLGMLRRIAPAAASAVEVGCGAGGALSVLRDAGLRTAGCDHSRPLIEFGAAQGMKRLAVGDLHALRAAIPSLGGEDLVYLHHVFEHMFDPGRFLRDCAPLLSPAGAVLVIVPDIARIDKFSFPGGDIRLFLHIAHKYNYSREGLRRLGAGCGYAAEFLEGFESEAAPEMWALFRPQATAAAELACTRDGARMLSYLRRTELRYRMGLLPGYGAGYGTRIRRVLKQVLPRPLVSLLRK
jgi:SAM-dependent methyltransferase